MAASDKPVIKFKFTPEQLAKGFTLRINPGEGPGPFEDGYVLETVFSLSNTRIELAGIKDAIILKATKAPKAAKARRERK